jgi:glucose-1-phosphate cytidylyltransferase
MEKHRSLDSDLTISTSAPLSRFGMVKSTDSGIVTDFLEKPPGTDVVNIGYMVAETSIFDYISGDEAFETGVLPRIARAGRLSAHNHQGFWQPMDTIREAEMLNQLWDNNQAAWKIW